MTFTSTADELIRRGLENEREVDFFNPKQLTSARIARGLTMKELAEKAELSRQNDFELRIGKKTIPKSR